MPRVHSCPEMPLTDVNPHHPAWDILETQGLALEKVKVLAEIMANDLVDGGDLTVLAEIVLDAVEKAERQRILALDTLIAFAKNGV